MERLDVILPAVATRVLPEVRSIGLQDLRDALAKGLEDFWAMPTHVIFLSLIYPVAGIAIGWATLGYDIVPLLYPVASGFALIGPLAAVGLYELSRRREQGLDTSWTHAFDVRHSPSFQAIVIVGLLLLAIFGIWLAMAHAIYVATFGYRAPVALSIFLHEVLTTPEGYSLIVIGNVVGFIFAVLAFSLTVVSFPLLLDRNVGAAVAIATSVRTVLRNPMMMAVWGLIAASGLIIGSLPLFLGLALVMPVLGHATWHLYRRVVVPDPSPRPEFHARSKARRDPSDFPAALFFPSGRKGQT